MSAYKKPVPKPGKPAAISVARKAAFQILMAVERGQSHSDDLLRGKGVNALSAPDRHLATALVLGALRWQIQLDRQLQALLARPGAKLDPEIRIALRLGAFQLLHMDRIPARAAIDESVELAKQAGHKFASGMVNAVLRKLGRTARAGKDTAGAEAPADLGTVTARLKSCPDTSCPTSGVLSEPVETTLDSAADVAADSARLKPSPVTKPGHASTKPGKSPGGPGQSAAGAAPEGTDVAKLALAEAHPAWMVERWAGFYGLETAGAICRHGQSQPVLTVRIVGTEGQGEDRGFPPMPREDETQVLRLRSAPLRMTGQKAILAELAETGVVLEGGELLTSAYTVAAGDITATAAFREGRVRLQDEGSQLVGELAGRAGRAAASILDACAAPGGKTLILAERNPAARIVACESSSARLEQLRLRLAGLGERVECRLADATALNEEAVYEVTLADVPCSGTGTLGRNPEIRHRLRLEDIARQAERQRAILAAALRSIRAGGRVVYSTCSLEPEENEQVVGAVLAAMPNARAVKLEDEIAALLGERVLTASGAERLRSSITPEGYLRLLPGVFHTDGFFVCVLERVEA
jgi:16S rRNA (cytosine967-C5)-methyltransferase